MGLKGKHIHFIGIGGSGLSAIARVLLERGCVVSGSDRTLSPQAQELAQSGARVFAGHRADQVQGADVVVRSSAVANDNVEVLAAQAASIPVLKRAEFLGPLMDKNTVVAIAGTHGKTTTTAMMAWVLSQLGLDPSYIIGGNAKNLHSNAHAGQGAPFVIEADEYDRMFLGLNPHIILITNMEHDHPDCYPTLDDYRQAFTAFVGRLQPGGFLAVSRDNPEARQLPAGIPQGTAAASYGMSADADYTADHLNRNSYGGFEYDAIWHTDEGNRIHLARVNLQVPGEHNVRNSLGVLASLHMARGLLGLSPEKIQLAGTALSEFQGTGRRFDVLGEVEGITVIDDYAHHPTKIQATLAAARVRYPEARIWAVWQPHTYSRTIGLLSDFARAFKNADRVLVTEIYAARESADQFEHFSAAQVVKQMDHSNAAFVSTLEEATQMLLRKLKPGDVLVVMSAGDADQISARVLAGLKERSFSHGNS